VLSAARAWTCGRQPSLPSRASNTAAQAFCKGLGFCECGRMHRQVVIDGVEDDEVLMELFC
jgi:hypothetical protein